MKHLTTFRPFFFFFPNFCLSSRVNTIYSFFLFSFFIVAVEIVSCDLYIIKVISIVVLCESDVEIVVKKKVLKFIMFVSCNIVLFGKIMCPKY